jgi:FKBP-type peptidyl-prolyl cis-trans isomerase
VIEETEFAASLEIDLASMTQTASGLYIRTIAEGTGEPAVAGNSVTVLYAGALSDGTVFDSSDQGGPFDFVLGIGGVVEGFDEGVIGMRVGGVRKIIIPPILGYGTQQVGVIPGGSILIFRIELQSIVN